MNSTTPNEVKVASVAREGEGMKKKIVYFLCELGLLKIANKISPSLVGSWRGKKIAQGIAKAYENATIVISDFANTMKIYQEQIKQITKETETDDK